MLSQSMIVIHYPSLKQQLADLLMDAIGSRSDSLPLQSIPLQVDPQAPMGIFLSPIALQLSGQQPAGEWAQSLLTKIPKPQELRLWAKPSGWIYGQFSEVAIATWLQQLTEQCPRLSEQAVVELDSSLSDPDLFPVQYAHARCCSLLRLAQRERMIDLQTETLSSTYAIATPITWCTIDNNLCLQHPAEQRLIQKLLEFPGLLQTSKQVWRRESTSGVSLPGPLEHRQLVRKAQEWGEDFQEFYRDCRIFGEVRQQSIALSQTRLGLVSATQRVLSFLLQDLLHLIAPLEL